MTMQTDPLAGAARPLTTVETLQVSREHNPPDDILPVPRPKSPGATTNSPAVPPDPY